MATEPFLILTCEHAYNVVPAHLYQLFRHPEIFDTHEGYDIGALLYAQRLSRLLKAPLLFPPYSRLLVDPNRSLTSSSLFSVATRNCSLDQRNALLSICYFPFRQRVLSLMAEAIQKRAMVIHLSCHSFAPFLHGHHRPMDLGILYDTRRPKEVTFSQRLYEGLSATTSMKIRRNAPYRGRSDGHVTFLRKLFDPYQYVGIELEVNQQIAASAAPSLWTEQWLPQLGRQVRQICENFS